MFSKGGNQMDRISYLAYLLYQVNHEGLKNAALKLLSGEVSIKEFKTTPNFSHYIEEAERTLKKSPLNKKDVYLFVEQYLYAY